MYHKGVGSNQFSDGFMWNYVRRKLGIDKLESDLAKLPMLDARHRQVLTAVESIMSVLNNPTPDDSLIMFHLRSMGFAGGWKVKDQPSNKSEDKK